MKHIVFRLEAGYGLGHFKRCDSIAKKIHGEYNIGFYSIYQDTIDTILKEKTAYNIHKFPSQRYPTNEFQEYYMCEHIAQRMQAGVYVIDMNDRQPSIEGLRLLKRYGWKNVIIDIPWFLENEEYKTVVNAFIMTHDHSCDKNIIHNPKNGIYSSPDFFVINDDFLSIKPKPMYQRRKEIYYFGGSTDIDLILPTLSRQLTYEKIKNHPIIHEYVNIFLHSKHSYFYTKEKEEYNISLNPLIYHTIWDNNIYEDLSYSSAIVCRFGRMMYEAIYLRMPCLVITTNEQDEKDADYFANKYECIVHAGNIKKKGFNILDKLTELYEKYLSIYEVNNIIDGLASKRIADLIISMT